MIRDASLYFLDRDFQMSTEEVNINSSRRLSMLKKRHGWLGPKNRNDILHFIAKPYLAGTESTLAIPAVSSMVIPSTSDQISGMGATLYMVLLFILDLFPFLKNSFQRGGEYQVCGELYREIGEGQILVS
jgi:hypothetical protein